MKDLPAITDYNLRQSSGNVGRTLWYFDREVSYPFGYGLSYTTFTYSNFRISKNAITPNDRITLSVTLSFGVMALLLIRKLPYAKVV